MTARRIPLQLKLSVALLFLVSIPLLAAALFVDQLGHAAANVQAGESASRVAMLNKEVDTYHALVDVTKRLQTEIAERLAARHDIIAQEPSLDLAKIIADEATVSGLRGLAIVLPDGTTARELILPSQGPQWRDRIVDEPLGNTGAVLRLTFAVSATIGDDLRAVKHAMDAEQQYTAIRNALPDGFRDAFLVILALASIVAIVGGIILGRRVTGPLNALVETTRRVSEGQVDARAEPKGRDEMAEVGFALNKMLDELDEARRQNEYLQRMGVWQDVARRLAHEIKNPLTPIQLAVQQCVSAYKGDDARFKRLLSDTGEIVEEEIASLRRLVDTFRTLGALPKVEAAPIALAEVVEELKLDPTMATRLTLIPPDAPVTVRADKLLLKRVLANLVENGIHAGQEAGTAGDVDIRWRTEGEAVEIDVDDRGKGVADGDREKIFEPYVTTKTTGTGLGLAIARKIAIEHGGDLRVAPGKAPTGGARFVVTLPLRAPETAAS
ncbi:MAG TPA: ATP-binding protein [Kofleriaceae bacterium]|jgi:nitrogen fixation/metabolism regulation signal transduction histidine kinase